MLDKLLGRMVVWIITAVLIYIAITIEIKRIFDFIIFALCVILSFLLWAWKNEHIRNHKR